MITLTTSVEYVSVKQAHEWLTQCAYPHQRPIRRWHVKELANEMLRGRFVPTAPIAFAHVGAHTYLVNGQHTLSAIIEADQPAWLIIAHYRGVSEDDVRRIYTHYDIGALRTVADAYRAYDLEARTGLNARQQSLLGGAVQMIHSGFTRAGAETKLAREDRMNEMIAWSPEMLHWWKLCSGSDAMSVSLRRAPVCAVALVTIRYAPPDKADDFWTQVAMDDGLRRGDPRKVLRDFLDDHRLLGGANTSRGVAPWQMARVVARCWNAYCDGEQITRLRIPDQFTPIQIKHTPYGEEK